MVWGVSQQTIDKNPELVKVILEIHRKATEYAMSNNDAKIEMAMKKLGQQRKSIEIAAPNVELTWNIDADLVKHAKAYASQMLEMKQIRQLPDFASSSTPASCPLQSGQQQITGMNRPHVCIIERTCNRDPARTAQPAGGRGCQSAVQSLLLGSLSRRWS